MNKYLKILIIFIIATTFTVSYVAANDMVMHDFDGKFKAFAPADYDFKEETSDSTILFYDGDKYPIFVYSESDVLNSDTVSEFFEGFSQGSTFNVVKTDGNLTILKNSDSDSANYAVGTFTDGKVVVVMGDNLNELKKIARSVEF